MKLRTFLLGLAAIASGGAQTIKPEIGYIAMKDGTKLAYILYRPPGQTRVPVLLHYNVYWGGGMKLAGDEKAYVDNGFAVLGVNARGSGCSQGVFSSLMESPQGEDGAALVEWAGTQSWSTGNVGIYGNSYSGVSQLITAAERPRHLKALAASGIVSDVYSELSYPGGMFNVGFLGRWTYGDQPASQIAGVAMRQQMDDQDCIANRAGQLPAGDSFVQHRAHPLRDAWWDHLDIAKKAERIEAPTLITQAWQDQQTGGRGPGRVYQRIRAPKKMILSNGAHALFRAEKLRAERIRWFNRWLKNERNDVEKEPPVTLWFEAVGEHGGVKPAWTWSFSDWPIPETKWTTFYLSADGRLAPQKPSGTSVRSYLYPFGTELIHDDATFSIPPTPEGSLVYRTAPLTQDMAIAGAPVVTLHASSDQKDTDFMVALHEVRPDGRMMYLQRGFLRASHRRLDPARSTADDPVLSHDSAVDLIPGKTYELQFALDPLGHVIRRGHSLEVAIMSPPTTPIPFWSFVPVGAPSINTIHHPSMIRIPVLPGRTAAAVAPKCGSLSGQPCRAADDLNKRKKLDEIFGALHEKKMPASMVRP